VAKRSKFFVPGSNAGVLTQGKLYGGGTTCPKVTYLRNKRIGAAPDFRAKCTFALGYAAEEVLVEYLKSLGKPVEDSLDARRGEPLEITDDTSFLWERDIVFKNGQFIELKSVSSLNTYKKVFAEGVPKYDNVLQAATYLLLSDTDKCNLTYLNFLYASFEKKKVKYKAAAGQMKHFKLQFNENGFLTVDNKVVPVSKEGILNYLEYVAAVLETEDWDHLKPESINGLCLADPKAVSPCMYCDFKTACEVSTSFSEFEENVLNLPGVTKAPPKGK